MRVFFHCHDVKEGVNFGAIDFFNIVTETRQNGQNRGRVLLL